MINILKSAFLTIFGMYKDTTKATLKIFKFTKDAMWRTLELRFLKGLQKDIKKYEKKAFYARAMMNDNQCSPKKAAKFLERAKKYDQYADSLRGAFEEEFDEYRRKYSK